MKDGTMIDRGITWMEKKVFDSVDKTQCMKHYMNVQVGVLDYDVLVTTGTISFRMGVKPWYGTLDPPTPPTKAADPKTPKNADSLKIFAGVVMAICSISIL
jgi:hypothetical protein